MSKRLDEVIANNEYDGLIIGNEPVADVVTVKLAAGNGTLKRGTVITGTAGGELAPASAALVATDAIYILTDETDATKATTATAYRCGKFNAGRLVAAGDYTLTAADIEVLRKCGIMVDTAIEL